MSAYGTNRTCQVPRLMSGYRGRADIAQSLSLVSLYDPKRPRATVGTARLVTSVGRRSACDGRALQIGSDDQRTCIRLFEFGDGGIEIEQSDVTDDQSSDARLLGDPPHHRRRRVK